MTKILYGTYSETDDLWREIYTICDLLALFGAVSEFFSNLFKSRFRLQNCLGFYVWVHICRDFRRRKIIPRNIVCKGLTTPDFNHSTTYLISYFINFLIIFIFSIFFNSFVRKSRFLMHIGCCGSVGTASITKANKYISVSISEVETHLREFHLSFEKRRWFDQSASTYNPPAW